MKQKWLALTLSLLLLFTACSTPRAQERETGELKRFETTFYDAFDTIIIGVVYAESQNQANSYFEHLHRRFLELHRLFDTYHTYPGLNNIKTINDNGGNGPVETDPAVIDLLSRSKEIYKKYGGTSIAMGSVTDLWRAYMEKNGYEGTNVQDESKGAEESQVEGNLPSLEELKKRTQHTDLTHVIIDGNKHTVEITDPELRLDVGAVAKGYATDIIAGELQAMGLTAGLISAGGDVAIIGKPPEADKEFFATGIQNPDGAGAKELVSDNIVDIIYANDTNIVTSGDYQRYFEVEGKRYHHIINPDTLMPAEGYRSITVMCQDGLLADFLSTALYTMPYEKGRKMAEEAPGVEVYWIFEDGTVDFTPGFKEHLESQKSGK